MPNLNAYIDFSVELDKSVSTPVIKLTDPNNYPAPIGLYMDGIFSITQPDGINIDGDFTSPDIYWSGSGLVVAEKELRLAVDDTFQNGLYTITYIVKCVGYTDTVLTKTFTLDYTAATIQITDLTDVFTPSLLETDTTTYTQVGFASPTITRAWSAAIKYVGTSIITVTGTAQVFNMVYNTYYYDAHYSITLATTLTYVLTGYSWATIKDKLTGTTQIDAYAPPTLADLRASLAIMKSEIEAGTYCGQPCNCGCGVDYTPYDTAVSLYDQIVARGQAGETIGLDAYIEQLEKMFICSGLLNQTHTNSPIYAYDFAGGSVVTTSFERIQFIVGQSGMLGGVTYYDIPFVVIENSLQVINQGVEVPKDLTGTDPDFSYTVSIGSATSRVQFVISGVDTAPPDGSRMIFLFSKI